MAITRNFAGVDIKIPGVYGPRSPGHHAQLAEFLRKLGVKTRTPLGFTYYYARYPR